jgi:outer membrane protein, heavy metal efflux system
MKGKLHMSCTLKGLVLAFILVVQPGVGLAEGPVLSLESLVEQALAANPQIEVARQQAARARQQVPQAGALDDPMLGFGILNVPDNFDLDAEGMTAKEITLSQRVPFFGKRGLRREVAAKQADAAHAEIDEIANQVIKSVKLVYFDLSHVYRATEVTRRNKAILEDFSQLAQTRYSVGQGIQEDVIRAQVEISSMLDELLMLDQIRLALEAKMNMVLNRPSSAPLGAPAEVMFEPYELNIDQLQATALDMSPMLKAIQREVEAEQKDLTLANRERYPDFNLRVGYGQRDNRPDMYSAMVEMNLPVFAKSKQNRRVDQAAAELSARRARYDAERNALFYSIAESGTMAQRLERRIELYRTGIIPQTTLQIQAAMSAYTVNRADFMTLLDSRMRLYRYELDYHQAITDYAKSIASLEASLGAPLLKVKE